MSHSIGEIGAGATMIKARPGSLGLAVIAACALLLSACAAPHAYMGIEFDSPAVDGNIIALARKAQSGDKQAQLELGIAFEEGLGVKKDLRRAEQLYRTAAANSGGKRTLYIPSSSGSVQPFTVSAGPLMPGIAEAKRRLLQISGAKRR